MTQITRSLSELPAIATEDISGDDLLLIRDASTGKDRKVTLDQVTAAVTGGTDKKYTHTQNSSSSVWSIQHNLNKRASITIVDSAGTEVIGSIQYVDDNNVTVTFSAPFTGYAYCN